MDGKWDGAGGAQGFGGVVGDWVGWEEGIVRLPKVLHQFMGTDRIERPKRI